LTIYPIIRDGTSSITKKVGINGCSCLLEFPTSTEIPIKGQLAIALALVLILIFPFLKSILEGFGLFWCPILGSAAAT